MLPFLHVSFKYLNRVNKMWSSLALTNCRGNVVVLSLILLLCGLYSAANAQSPGTLSLSERAEAAEGASVSVIVALPTMNKVAPSTFVSPITVDNVTGLNISAYQFNILYDPSVIAPSGGNYGCSTTGTLSAAAGIGAICNTQIIDATHAKVLVAAFGSGTLTGSGTILNVQFATTGVATDVSPLIFQDLYLFNNSGFVGNSPIDGQITLDLAPTAADASISGRTLSSIGRPIPNVQVLMTNGMGVSLRAISNPFGYYRFENVATGPTYVLSGSAKRYVFQSRMVSVIDDLTAIDLVANP